MRVAIFGTGQLARMMAQAAEPLGISCCFIRMEGESTVCVDGLGDLVTLEEHGDAAALFAAMGQPQVVTVEKEAVPVAVLRELQAYCPVHPNPDAIEVIQHRGREKSFLTDLGIATTGFAIVEAPEQLAPQAAQLRMPLIAKSMTSGYDGKHQWKIREQADLASLAEVFPEGGVILEEMVTFTREVSFIAARNTAGELRFYPGVENLHLEGILATSLAPAPNLSDAMVAEAQDWLSRLMQAWNYVGVLTMECFDTEQGLLVNELAPRVHNSGHWTMQPGIASQFENHIRAVSGMVLGETRGTGYYGMVNILGPFNQERHQSLIDAIQGDVHWYQKSPKPRRKVGHINTRNDSQACLKQDLEKMLQALYPGLDLDKAGN